MNIKRITCILLTLVMVLALSACGSSSNNSFTTARTTKNPIDIDVLADAERANLPETTEDYALVLEETKASKVQIDKYLTKQIAAYENFKDEEAKTVLRMFEIAKKCGCKFYMGSDAHSPADLDRAKAIFERAIDYLELKETDKFYIEK